jgi:hypothetical protein
MKDPMKKCQAILLNGQTLFEKFDLVKVPVG